MVVVGAAARVGVVDEVLVSAALLPPHRQGARRRPRLVLVRLLDAALDIYAQELSSHR